MRKKFVLPLLTGCLLSTPLLFAQSSLQKALPLLQKNTRSQAQTQQVLNLFRSSKDPNTVFAAGASLVKIPPAKVQEPALFNLLLRSSDPLKQIFSAIIITAMGSMHEELSPVLEGALESKDPALRAYTAGAYAILHPENTTYVPEVIRLYIYDPAFSQRALNLLASNDKTQLKFLKQAAASQDSSVRTAAVAYLGGLHTQPAAKQLLKMAKKETDSLVSTQLATALAKNKDYTLPSVAKELKRDPASPTSATYALALGFMTGHAVDSIRQGLLSKNEYTRINSIRAAAYMAGVLSTPDAFAYSSDRVFDTGLLKSLIPQISLLARTGNETVRMYAENALLQIEKLMK